MASQRAFLAVSALLLAGSAALTIVWCASMSAMGMPMPGGWTMSMAWMQGWMRRGEGENKPRGHCRLQPTIRDSVLQRGDNKGKAA
jgi:hypothetical protein